MFPCGKWNAPAQSSSDLACHWPSTGASWPNWWEVERVYGKYPTTGIEACSQAPWDWSWVVCGTREIMSSVGFATCCCAVLNQALSDPAGAPWTDSCSRRSRRRSRAAEGSQCSSLWSRYNSLCTSRHHWIESHVSLVCKCNSSVEAHLIASILSSQGWLEQS